jgi:hypothetical protein
VWDPDGERILWEVGNEEVQVETNEEAGATEDESDVAPPEGTAEEEVQRDGEETNEEMGPPPEPDGLNRDDKAEEEEEEAPGQNEDGSPVGGIRTVSTGAVDEEVQRDTDGGRRDDLAEEEEERRTSGAAEIGQEVRVDEDTTTEVENSREARDGAQRGGIIEEEEEEEEPE